MQEDLRSDGQELQARLRSSRDRLEEGETLDDILVERPSRRSVKNGRLRMRPFHVQVMGGIMHQR